MRAAILLALTLASATLQPAIAVDEDSMEICAGFSSIAEDVMRVRQKGMAMSQIMEKLANGELSPLMEQMIIAAYDEPRYYSEGAQERSVQDFRDQVYLECIKARQGSD